MARRSPGEVLVSYTVRLELLAMVPADGPLLVPWWSSDGYPRVLRRFHECSDDVLWASSGEGLEVRY